MDIKIGDRVASPYRRNRFNAVPYEGRVLSPCDPRAWLGTAAGASFTTQEDIQKHLEYCRANGPPDSTVPVLWDFKGVTRAYWEQLDSIVPYDAELAAWHKAGGPP